MKRREIKRREIKGREKRIDHFVSVCVKVDTERVKMAESSSSAQEDPGPARLYSKNGNRSFNVVVSRSPEELAERMGLIVGSRILENPSLSIGITVGVRLASLALFSLTPND